jgi:hypothetical protein
MKILINEVQYLRLINEQRTYTPEEKEIIRKEIIDYVSQFETYSDFVNSPKFNTYKLWLRKYFKQPHKYSLQNLTKDLNK